MFIPGFYPENYSDQELLNKTHELAAKLVSVSNGNGNFQLMNQIQNMLAVIEEVRKERLLMEILKKHGRSDIVESDPAMKSPVIEKPKPKINIIKRTDKPVRE